MFSTNRFNYNIEVINNFFVICDYCGGVCFRSDMRVIGGESMCNSCYIDNYIRCDNCGANTRIEEIINEGNYEICEDCHDNELRWCEDCGEAIIGDDIYWDRYDNPVCEDCYHNQDNSIIKSYDYIPYPFIEKRTEKDIDEDIKELYGLELEFNSEQYDCEEVVEDIVDDLYYFKEDGSLSNGCELVTHPLSLDYHLNKMDYKGILSHLIDYGCQSHNGGECGLHIHINRTSFSDESLKVFIGYFIRFEEQLIKFSRRTPNNMNWCNSIKIKNLNNGTYYYDEDYKEYLRILWTDKYYMINTRHNNSIEVRLMRGTLNYKTFILTLHLINFLKLQSNKLEIYEDFYRLKTDFIEYCKEYRIKTYAIDYLKRRDL